MRFFVPLALVGALALPALADQPTSTVTVTGEGFVNVVPDVATISLGVTVNGETAKAALDANSTALTAVIEKLKAAGIEEKDIQTSGLYLGPVYDYASSSGTPQAVLGYTASNNVTVFVRAIDQVGPVLDASVTDGANVLNGVTFGVLDQVPVVDQARDLAVADARRKAELLARAGGVTLGGIVTIAEQGGYAPPMPMAGVAMEKSASPPIAAGQMQIGTTVTVTYTIAE